jgi:ribonuclease-3
LAALQRRLTYDFREPSLLARALTHPSVLPDRPSEAGGNQRLEFLGDAVLQLILTEELFRLYPGDREGALSGRRALLASGAFLAGLAAENGLEGCLRSRAGEEASGGRARSSALADALEALIGAVYLDSDFGTARRVVLGIYGPLPDRLAGRETEANPKGRLQELVQPRHGNDALNYETTHVAGDDHAREYEAAVHLRDRLLGRGRGPSKKLAEEAAARAALAARPIGIDPLD